MSIHSHSFPAAEQQAAVVQSNILGATGLPRAVLAAMFRRDGLFGRESDLNPAEQAVLQSRLPAIPGLATRALPTFQTPRLAALADFVSARFAGRASSAERAKAEREGLSEAALSEVLTVIENVRVVFRPVVEQAKKLSLQAEPLPVFAKAA